MAKRGRANPASPNSPRLKSDRAFLREYRLTFLQMRGEALARLGTRKTQKLQRGRGVEDRAVDAQPVVERVFGPADSALRAVGQIFGGLERDLLQIGILDAQRNQPDPLRLRAGQRLAGEQVIFRLGKPAQQRPDDAGDIAGRDPEPGVAIDDARGLSADRHVGEDADHQSGTDRDAVDRRDDRLVAIDDVVDEILGFLPCRHARDRIVEDALDQLKIAAGRKRLAGAGNDHRVDIGIVVDVSPYVGELGMGFRIDRIVGLGPVECDTKNALRWIIQLQSGVGLVTLGHRFSLTFIRTGVRTVSYTHLRAHETDSYLVCRLL